MPHIKPSSDGSERIASELKKFDFEVLERDDLRMNQYTEFSSPQGEGEIAG
jgi:hypothetical protein